MTRVLRTARISNVESVMCGNKERWQIISSVNEMRKMLFQVVMSMGQKKFRLLIYCRLLIF